MRITWHPLQSKVCNAKCAPKLGTDGLNCMGVPQNGQRGCGASVSMHWLIAPEWLMKSKFDLQRRPFHSPSPTSAHNSWSADSRKRSISLALSTASGSVKIGRGRGAWDLSTSPRLGRFHVIFRSALVIRSASAMKMARVCEFSQASAIRDLALANRSGLRVGSEERSRSTVRAQVFSRRSAACRG